MVYGVDFLVCFFGVVWELFVLEGIEVGVEFEVCSVCGVVIDGYFVFVKV